jgi:DNA-binding transcriptional MerR regulator
MTKSADAFRTISEVADWLGVQPHVLRFWESKFTQVKPVKRAGGRRYYRPSDMLLLGGIRKLLHEDGLTIKGVQKIMREEGMAYVVDLSPSLDEDLSTVSFDEPEADYEIPASSAQRDMFAGAVRRDVPEQSAPASGQGHDEADEVDEAPMAEDVTPDAATVSDLPSFLHRKRDETPAPQAAPPAPKPADSEPATFAQADTETDAPTTLPSFLQANPAASEDAEDTAADAMAAELEDAAESPPAAEPAASETDPEPVALKPLIIDAPDPDESALTAAPGALTAACHTGHLTCAQRQAVVPLLARLAAHRDRLKADSTQTGAR